MKKLWFLKMMGICLCVCVGLFLFTPYLQAATPTYIQLEFSDMDYDEAQYIKFIIDADKDFKIVLYMKDNENNTFYVTYQTDNEDTGDLDKDDNKKLIIYLDEDEYVTGHDETFDSFTHGNSLSFDEYINNQWEEQEYDGGFAELEKIRIYGNQFNLYYIAIDDGDFSDPTWEIDVSDGIWDGLADFKDDGHTYSSTTNISFQYDDYIHIIKNSKAAATEDSEAAAGYPYGYYSSFQGGYPGYGYPGGYYAGYSGYGYPGGTYGPGYNPFSSLPSGITNMMASPNPNVAQMGNELSRLMSGWSPWQATYRPQTYYGGYSGYGYPGGTYGPGYNPFSSMPSVISNMMLHSAYDPSEDYIGDLGYQLSLPYFQSAVRSGWSPWSSPYGSQTYNRYGGYPWGY